MPTTTHCQGNQPCGPDCRDCAEAERLDAIESAERDAWEQAQSEAESAASMVAIDGDLVVGAYDAPATEDDKLEVSLSLLIDNDPQIANLTLASRLIRYAESLRRDHYHRRALEEGIAIGRSQRLEGAA